MRRFPLRRLGAEAILLPVHLYRWVISPVLPSTCRYRPTCSRYAVRAVRRHGILKGAYLAGRRVLRCHPFHPGGIDPVP